MNMGEETAGQISGWVGALIVAAVVWIWDDCRLFARYPRQSISGAHWEKPLLAAGIWTYLWMHIVLRKPRRVLVRW